MKAIFVCLAVLFAGATAQSQYMTNGSPAETRQQYKWHVRVQPGGLNVLYAGFVITDSWVLTCAVCANKASTYNLGFGYYNMSDTTESQRVDRAVEKPQIFIHPEFDSTKFNVKNIALMQLLEPLAFTVNIGLIGLPPNGTAIDGYIGWVGRVSGFGKDSAGANDMMRYADMNVVADTVCPGLLDDGQMCTTPFLPGSGPCEDEGSALYIVDPTPIAIGIFSYGFGDGPCPGNSALFTHTVYYLDWITETISNATQGTTVPSTTVTPPSSKMYDY